MQGCEMTSSCGQACGSQQKGRGRGMGRNVQQATCASRQGRGKGQAGCGQQGCGVAGKGQCGLSRQSQGRGHGRAMRGSQTASSCGQDCGSETGRGRKQGRGQGRSGRGYQMVSLKNTGCSQNDCGTTGCKSTNGCGQQKGCQLTSTQGRGCGSSGHACSTGCGQQQSTCGKSGGCQLAQSTCNDGPCSKTGCRSSACSGCDKAGAGCGTSTQGCGSKGKCGEGQTATGCEGCPESGGACDVTESEQVSPNDVSLDAFIGLGRGGGWGRRWWNDESASPLPKGDHEKGGCQDGKCPSENDKQDEAAE